MADSFPIRSNKETNPARAQSPQKSKAHPPVTWMFSLGEKNDQGNYGALGEPDRRVLCWLAPRIRPETVAAGFPGGAPT